MLARVPPGVKVIVPQHRQQLFQVRQGCKHRSVSVSRHLQGGPSLFLFSFLAYPPKPAMARTARPPTATRGLRPPATAAARTWDSHEGGKKSDQCACVIICHPFFIGPPPSFFYRTSAFLNHTKNSSVTTGIICAACRCAPPRWIVRSFGAHVAQNGS